jgi:hypothetical protein
MAILRAQAIFPMFTGIPRDVITNTMHFSWDESGTFAAAATEVAARLTTFFNGVYDGAYHANYVVWPSGTVEVTNLDDPTPRIPEVRPLVVTGSPGNSTLPTECAVVMTYAAAETGGVIRQRLYNRIYIGGLMQTAMSAGTVASFPTIVGVFRDRVSNAANALLLENDALLQWIQFSPTAGVARAITRGWVDNSPDTQRRRSVDASARTTWLP